MSEETNWEEVFKNLYPNLYSAVTYHDDFYWEEALDNPFIAEEIIAICQLGEHDE